MYKIEWSEKHEPVNPGQNHYIFDKDWRWKTFWMKEQINKEDDWIYKIYIDVKEEDYFKNFIFQIEEYIESIWRKDEYIKDIIEWFCDWNLEINNFRDLTNYLNILLENNFFEINKKSLTRLMLFIDNCDILQDETRKELNSLVWYRWRNIVYFLWIKWEEKDYIYHTDSENIVISSWHDYMKYTIINILEW